MSNEFQLDCKAGAADAELEGCLRDLYRGEEPPAALTGCILEQARAHQRRPKGSWLRRHAPLVSICSVLLAVCVYFAAGVVHRHQAQARRAQQARARLLQALQIATGELNWAETTIQRRRAAGFDGGHPR